MTSISTSCFRNVVIAKNCPKCGFKTIRHGKDANKKQRYFCSSCKKTLVEKYTYNAYKQDTNKNIIAFTKENVGILGTARLLKISPITVIRRIKKIASSIVQPSISINKTYEVDEMRTYIQRKDKLIWIVYALEQETKKIVSFHIGSRTNKTLSVVLKTLKNAKASKIYTDKLKNYKYLIDGKIHSTKYRGTNHIERSNLTIRTHLKRLNRRTISFSKSALMLSAILKIYFWG